MKLFSSLHDFTCLGVFLCIVMDLTYAHSITILGKKVEQNVVFCKFLQFSITAFIQGQEHPLHTSGAQSSFTGMGMTSSKHMVIDVHITCSTQFIAAFEILNLMTVHQVETKEENPWEQLKHNHYTKEFNIYNLDLTQGVAVNPSLSVEPGKDATPISAPRILCVLCTIHAVTEDLNLDLECARNPMIALSSNTTCLCSVPSILPH